ncbi:MAG: tRNA threonylcarbamoyladenosine dehydratase [Pleomorphochaeta sp.]
MNSDQFLRISRFIGDKTVEELHTKKVTIVGMGAVGSLCLEALARSGVGHFTIIDFDEIGVTNINRQIIATWDTLERVKVEVAKERVLSINRDCEVKAIKSFFSEDNASSLIDNDCDLVIDAIDSLNPKCSLLSYCYLNNIPIISSMGAALRRDPILIQSGDLFDTYGCPLAKLVRKRLRRRGVDRGIEVIYSPEVIRFEYKNPEEEEHVDFNEQILERGRVRNVLGSLPTITGIFALNLAHLALKKLLGDEEFRGEPAFDSKEKFKQYKKLNKK